MFDMIQLVRDNIINGKILAAVAFLSLGTLGGVYRAMQGIEKIKPMYEELKDAGAFKVFVKEIREAEGFSGLEHTVQKSIGSTKKQAESRTYSSFNPENVLAKTVFNKKYSSTVDALTSEEITKQYQKRNEDGSIQNIIITPKSDTKYRLDGALAHKNIHFHAYKLIARKNPRFEKYSLFPFITIAAEAKESAGDCERESEAVAVGCMQYKKKSAEEDGLIINHFIDERKDPQKSIPAAARRIAKFALRYDSIETALAMFNAGEKRIRGAMEKAGSNDFWAYKMHLSEETQKYVQKVIAMARILTNPMGYGIPIKQKDNQLACEKSHEIKPGDTLHKIRERYGINEVEIKYCNPALLSLTKLPRNYHIKIPSRG